MPGEAGRRRIRGVHRPVQEAAQQLHRQLTPAERVLSEALRSRQVAGLRFRNQHAIGPFVLDFYCPAANLVIEVDGSIHDQQAEQDAARTEHLEAYGYRVLRFRNEEVLTQLPLVLARIEQAAAIVPAEGRSRQGTRTASRQREAAQAPHG